MADMNLPKGWSQGQRGATTVAHDLAWTWTSTGVQKQYLRVQFDTATSDYALGRVSFRGRRSRAELARSSGMWAFTPLTELRFKDPVAAMIWAQIEGLCDGS